MLNWMNDIRRCVVYVYTCDVYGLGLDFGISDKQKKNNKNEHEWKIRGRLFHRQNRLLFVYFYLS